MDLPDCPPGAEGYHDSVVEMPKKPDGEESSCTKAEQEFQDHLLSLKIRLENGDTRPMVERRGRDISGKWIYLCYPCAAVCSGEVILQGHISGRKHKTKLGMRNTWPVSIFDDHPFNQCQKTGEKEKQVAANVLKKMAEEVELHNKPVTDLDQKYGKFRLVTCHIQYSIDAIKAPIIGCEYLVEHPPEEEHYEPSYMCTLCTKQGHPRTILNHMTCFWHRYNYINRHFPKACQALKPLMSQPQYREGVSITLNRISQRIEDKYGRLRPVHIDKDVYDREKDKLMQWIYKGPHLSERDGVTFEEVVDIDLIQSLNKSVPVPSVNAKPPAKKDPSPPVVAKPKFQPKTNTRSYRNERRLSMDLSDISDDESKRHPRDDYKSRMESSKPRWEPYHPRKEEPRMRYTYKNAHADRLKDGEKAPRPPNYEYKVKLSEEKRKAAEDAAKKMLAYHEKNPEKHPLYPDEWKKFWNRRYKEIQAEGKDASKHDFKPEWIVFWTKRMKELHDEELRVQVIELYRKMNVSPPDMSKPEPERRRSPERKPDHVRRRSPEYRRSSDRGNPLMKRTREMNVRHKSPERRRTPERRRSPPPRPLPDYRAIRRSPDFRHPIPDYRHSQERRRSRSRSPLSRRSPPRTNIILDSMERSRSPLSRRNAELPIRNRSPAHREPPPSMQTVQVSDDELKPDDNLSPWNSDNDIDSVCSLIDIRSVSGSGVSRNSRRRDGYAPRGPDPNEMGSAENVVATLRMLVALEDYLGSIGPKIVDLLTEALKMEKEKANSSEELLVRESAVALIETAKEKLKGAAQAGLVASAAAPAVRAAVVRAAATLHEADTRLKRAQAEAKKSSAAIQSAQPMPVAGVGEVDRAQIAQQMAAALIAQGKTDVTSEELAQLVDAVVGMAEAKKREAEATKKVESRPTMSKPSKPKLCGTATALQMLQSAYDEDKKEALKEDIPDAMDGLSDSDLETLLKNFNELSAEEQHSLIAYLKKLEAREPQRVERLRQYVSAAATSTAPARLPSPKPQPPPPQAQPTPPPPPPRQPSPMKEPVNVVTVESDDDDYTVEEVIESAQQKVKEDQMRKEIEIVKKSLEELKEKEATPPKSPAVDITKSVNLSSASDLLALVQASIQSSTSAAKASHTSDVVASSTQPRSYGDMPAALEAFLKPQSHAPIAMESVNPAPLITEPAMVKYNNEPFPQDEPMNQPPNNFNSETYNQNQNYQDLPYSQGQSYNQTDTYNQGDSYNNGDSYAQPQTYNQTDSYNENPPYQGDSYNNEPYNQNQQYNQAGSYNQNEPYNQNESYNQGTFGQNQYQNQNPPYQNQNQQWNQQRPKVPDNRPAMNQGYNNFNQGGGIPTMMSHPGPNNFNQNRGNFMNGNKNQQFRGRGGRGGQRGRGRGGRF